MPSNKSNQKPQPDWRFEAIGTTWSIETVVPLSRAIRADISARIESFDKTYSRFRDDSLVAQIAKQTGEYVFPNDSIKLLELYRGLYDATKGAMTPFIGDTLGALGYDKTYSLMPGSAQPVMAWDDVMRWSGTTVIVTKPTMIDVGAIGKGYLVDEVAMILEGHGVDRYVVDASGDMRCRGDTQTVGLEHPYDTSMVIGVAQLQDASLCGSATNRRRWGSDLHHVIDGRTGRPTQNVVATWVVAATTALADGLATALFFVDADDLKTTYDFEFVRMYHDGHVERSAGFVGKLFL